MGPELLTILGLKFGVLYQRAGTILLYRNTKKCTMVHFGNHFGSWLAYQCLVTCLVAPHLIIFK